MFARLRIFFDNLFAVVGASLALSPLLFRRRPLGRRTAVVQRDGRIIALEERRKVQSPSAANN